MNTTKQQHSGRHMLNTCPIGRQRRRDMARRQVRRVMQEMAL